MLYVPPALLLLASLLAWAVSPSDAASKPAGATGGSPANPTALELPVRDLFARVTLEPAPAPSGDTYVRRAASGLCDVSALSEAASPATATFVRFAPFADVDLVFRSTGDRPRGTAAAGTFAGTLANGADGTAQFAWAEGALQGSVRVDDRLWKIRALPGAPARIEEIDETRLPPCLVTRREAITSSPTTPAAGQSAALVVGHPTIDLLVVYPPSAVAAEGGIAAMEALVDLAILETNQAYAASGVTQRVRLVHRAELVGYTPHPSHGVELGRLQSPSDGFLDQVPLWRDQCGADAVVMIADAAGGSCGVAFLMGTTDPGFASLAYGVVSRTCATGFYTFGHELGHVMGLTHDRDNASDKVLRASYSSALQGGNQASFDPSVSALGRFVTFASDATNLVAADGNGVRDVFLRDRTNYATVRVSVASGGGEANGASTASSVSQSGTRVAFQSAASNLVANDTNGVEDVFLHDTSTSTTTCISVALAGTPGNGAARDPALSDNGRYVAFESSATNLVAGAAGQQIHVRDTTTGTTSLVSVSSSGVLGNAASTGASISSDGRYVAFTSLATNLVAGDTNGVADVFVRDRVAGTTTRVSVGPANAQANAASADRPWISAAGGRVAFASSASNLVTGDTNGTWDVFVRDLALGTTSRVSVNDAGVQGNGPSGWLSRPSITLDGRFVAFASRATNLVAGDANGSDDVFVRDLNLASTQRVSVTPSGNERVGHSGAVDSVTSTAIASANADAVAYTSTAQLEVLDGNAIQDVYAYQFSDPNPSGADPWSFGFRTFDNVFRTIMSYAPGTRIQRFSNPAVTWSGYAMGIAHPSPYSAECWRTLNGTASTVAGFRPAVYTTFCSGDGSATSCPCGNASPVDSGAGCANSLALFGSLEARGTASLSNDTVRLFGGGMPNGPALYFQGTSTVAAGLGVAFGDGLRCAGGSVRRLGVLTNVANQSSFPPSSTLSLQAAVATPGTLHYQLWYRDSGVFCTSSTFNLTNGVSIAWQP